MAGIDDPHPVPGPGPLHPQFDDAVLDRQMVRHLAKRYTLDQIARLFKEEVVCAHSDQASFVSSPYAPSVVSDVNSALSDDPASVFDTASVRSSSDTSSITGSIISNVSGKTSRFLGRKSPQTPSVTSRQSPAAATLPSQSSSSWPFSPSKSAKPDPDRHQTRTADAAVGAPAAKSLVQPAPSPVASKQKGIFICGFCDEENIPKTCTRKNDLKRHIEDFHNADAQWFCRQGGCSMVFDWQAAYKTHLKAAHGGSRMALDEAKVNLCPQVVFACGFAGCAAVFEAASEGEPASATFKDYVAHVVKHFDDNNLCGISGRARWSYTVRMRNLLRQVGVGRAWAETVGSADSTMRWSPQTSGVLRKRLETRHLGDVRLLVRYAFHLGQPDSAIVGQDGRMSRPHDDFVTPIRDECAAAVPGHKTRADVQVARSSHDAGGDSTEFRIPRGANPGLAAFIASQRSIRVPSRSAIGGGGQAGAGAGAGGSVRGRHPVPHGLGSYRPSASMTAPMLRHQPSAHFFSPLPPDMNGLPPPPLCDSREEGGGGGGAGMGTGTGTGTRAYGSGLNVMGHHGCRSDNLSAAADSFGPPAPDVVMADPGVEVGGFGSVYGVDTTGGDATSWRGSHGVVEGHHPFYEQGRSHAY